MTCPAKRADRLTVTLCSVRAHKRVENTITQTGVKCTPEPSSSSPCEITCSMKCVHGSSTSDPFAKEDRDDRNQKQRVVSIHCVTKKLDLQHTVAASSNLKPIFNFFSLLERLLTSLDDIERSFKITQGHRKLS